MPDTIKIKKKELRSELLKHRDTLSAEKREELSSLVNDKLFQLFSSNSFRNIHTFLPMGSEPNIYPFIEFLLEKKMLVLAPKTLKNRKLEHRVLTSLNDIEKGVYGTTYPKGKPVFNDSFDLILVPGLAFGKDYKRLGYGGGYYDNFLSQHKSSLKVGLCFPFQVFDEVPTESHDIAVNRLIY